MDVVRNTNAYAGQRGLFSDSCGHTSLVELKKFLGLLIRLGVCPTHDVKSWWSSPESSFCFGDERPQHVMTGQRFDQLRTMLHLSPPGDTSDKFGNVLTSFRDNCEGLWVLGETLSIDELTIGCGDRSAHMTRIKYKREGDGYQFDAVCEREYTFSFWPRWTPPPASIVGVAPTFARMLWLIERTGGKWHRIYCDNLYISAAVLRRALDRKTLVAGTCREGGRGFPAIADQAVAKGVTAIAAAKNTVKAAVSTDSALLAVSVYDSKPVRLMSTIHTTAALLDKTRQVWDATTKKRVPLTYKRLNIVDDYNHGMNSVDLADKARMLYRPDTYLRFKKWWWSIFVWVIGTAATNAYVLYAAQCRKAGKEPCEHKMFRSRLAEQLCGIQQEASGVAPAAAGGVRKRARRVDADWCEKFTGRTEGSHVLHVMQDSRTDCQLCKAETGRCVKAKLSCRTCEVNFCLGMCWETWHTKV